MNDVVIGISVLPLGWNGDLKKGMPSLYFGVKGLTDRVKEYHYVTIGMKNQPKHEIIESIHIHRYTVNFKPSNRKVLYTFTMILYWLIIVIKSHNIASKIAKKSRPNIIIAHTYYAAIPTYLLSKKYKTPSVFREYGTMQLYNLVNKGFIGKLRRFYEVLAYKLNFNLFILTDDGSKTDCAARKLGVSKEKIVFLRNGYFETKDVRPIDSLRDKFVLTTASRLTKYKNVDKILIAFANSVARKDAILIIIGEGELKNDLVKLSDKLGINDSILFTGAITREKVLEYFMSSEIVLSMGSINPLLESMTCGKAVITLNLGDTNKIVSNKVNGLLLEENNIVLITNAINLLYENDILRKETGLNAKKFIENNYDTWEHRIQKEVNEIMKLIEKRNKL